MKVKDTRILVTTALAAAVLLLPTSSAVVFQLQPGTNRSLCLTVPGGSNTNGQTLAFAPCDGANTFQQINEMLPGVQVLQFVTGLSVDNSFKCLDTVGATANGARVTQEACNPAARSQYWTQPATPPPGGALLSANWIRNFVTNRCLTEEAGYVDNYDCTNGAFHQLWTIGANDFSVGGSPVRNALYGNCLEVVGGNPNAGAAVNVGVCSAPAWYQHYFVVNKTVEMFNFVGTGANKCADGGGSASNVYQYDCTPTAKNHWWLKVSYFNEATASGFYFVDMLSGLCLTWNPTNLNSVTTSACVMGNTNQQFMKWYV